MYFSRIKIKPNLESFRQITLLTENIYRAHQILWKLFPKDKEAERDFLFRQEIQDGIPYYYLVSGRKPEKLENLFTIQSKTYNPIIHEGQSFFFKLRINPIVAKKNPSKKHSAKHDIWMNFKKEGKNRGLEKSALRDYVNDKVKHWLMEKSESYGFSLAFEEFEQTRYTTNKVRKTGSGAKISFSALDFEGRLTVKNKELFLSTIFNGMGRARAFGCGLLMIRKV